MNKTILKPTFAVLAIALAVAGCNSGSSSSSGGGGGDGDTSNDLVANTSGATAFAFLQGSQNDPAATPAPRAMSATSPTQFSGNSGYCDSLVKVVEVIDPDNEDSEAYETVKVFETYGDDIGRCRINTVLPMRDTVVLEGEFTNLATADGEKIDLCKLIKPLLI